MNCVAACTLLLAVYVASAARTEPFGGRHAVPLPSLREPIFPGQVHVPSDGCSSVAPAARSAAAAYGASPVELSVTRASRSSCSVSDFRIQWAGTGSALPAACNSVQLQKSEGEGTQPRLLILSRCAHDAVVTLQLKVGSGSRRALRDSIFNAQGQDDNIVAKPAAGSGTNQTIGGGGSNNLGFKPDGACQTNCPTSSTILILLVVTFGVIFIGIVLISVFTRCGPCSFCWWAWRHRNDPPVVQTHRCPCKGDPVKAAQQISGVVAACSDIQREKAGECPVCLTAAEGDWSTLPCKHAICNTCLAQLVKAQAMLTKCPLCRDPLLPDAEEHLIAESSTRSRPSSILMVTSVDSSSADSRPADTAAAAEGQAAGDGSGAGNGVLGASRAPAAAAAPAIAMVRLGSGAGVTPAAAAVAAAGESLCSPAEAAEVDSILQPNVAPRPEPPIGQAPGPPLRRQSQDAGPSSG